jgi:hypothetical protein
MIKDMEVETSDLERLYNEYLDEFGADSDDKFDFAFALLAFCNDWHSGMGSELYALSSALYLEWQFEPNYSYYDPDNIDQRMIYEWLETKQEIGEL